MLSYTKLKQYMLTYLGAKVYLKQLFYQKPLIWKMLETAQGFMYVFDYVYYYKLWGHQNRSSIKEFNIEFASQCNLRCKFCSLDHTKPKTIITEEILRLFLDVLISDKRLRSIEIINLHNGGEILLHPKRIEMLTVLKEYKDRARDMGIKFPKIHLLTNGMLLGEKLSKEIIDLEVVDLLGLSMDGGTPEAFEEMRTNAKWPKFYSNVKAFCRLNDEAGHKVETYSICCIPDDKSLKTKWMDPEFTDLLETLDRYEIRRLHNWAGEVSEVSRSNEKPHKIGCSLLMRQLVLLPSGDVTVCCSDLNSKGVIGNILKEDVISIYKSKNRRKYLDLHLRGKKEELDLCRDCETL